MALPKTQYDELFQEAGDKHGVDPAILKAIASVESNFRPDAVGPKTRSGQAKGLMQFAPATAKAYGLNDPFDAKQSVDAAARLMKDLIKQFDGDVGNALEAYNGGPRLVGKSKQTAAYREKVLQRAKLTGQTQTAQKLPPTTPRQSLSSINNMPPGYKAALALQYFTDLDPEGNPIDDAEQTLSEFREQQEFDAIADAKPSGGGTFLQKFFAEKNKESVSPFDIMFGMQQEAPTEDQGPEQVAQAQGFAEGGFAFRGTSLPGMPDPSIALRTMLSPEEMAFYKARDAEIDRYNLGIPGYEKAIADYNKSIEAYNAGPRTSDFNVPEPKEPTAPGFNVEAYNTHIQNLNAKQQRLAKLIPQQEIALDVVNDPSKYNLAGFGFNEGGSATRRNMLERVKQFIVENELTPADIMLTPKTIPLGLLLQPSGLNEGEDELLERYRRARDEEQGKVVNRREGSGPRAEESLDEELLLQMMLGQQPTDPVYEEPPIVRKPQSEVPSMDRLTGRVMRDEPQPEFRGTPLQEFVGAAEAAASVGTGVTSLVPGTGRIIKGLLTPGETAEQTQKAASQIMQDFTYLPKGKAGQRNIEDLQDVFPQELTGVLPILGPITLAPRAASILRQQAKDAMGPGDDGPSGMSPSMGLQTALATPGQSSARGSVDSLPMRPAEDVAGPSITQAVRPGGGEVFSDYDFVGFAKRTEQEILRALFEKQAAKEREAEAQARLLDPSLPRSARFRYDDLAQSAVDKKQEQLELRAFEKEEPNIQDASDFIRSRSFQEKIKNYVQNQYGSPNDPLYNAYMRGEYNIFSALMNSQDSAKKVTHLTILKEEKINLIDRLNKEKSDPNADVGMIEMLEEDLIKLNKDFTAVYDELTPFRINMNNTSIKNRLKDDVYRNNLVNEIITEQIAVAKRMDTSFAESVGINPEDWFNTPSSNTYFIKNKIANADGSGGALSKINQQLLNLSNNKDGDQSPIPPIPQTFSELLDSVTNKDGDLAFFDKSTNKLDLSFLFRNDPDLFQDNFEAAKAYNIKRNFKKQLIDEMSEKIIAQGGIPTSTGKGTDPNVRFNFKGVLELDSAQERGKPTLLPSVETATPIDYEELAAYLTDTPRKDYENKTFPQIVLDASKSDYWKRLTDAIAIAKRANLYKALLPEQRFMGTTTTWSNTNDPSSAYKPANQRYARVAPLSDPEYKQAMQKSGLPGAQWREIIDERGIKIEGRLNRNCLSLRPEETSQYEEALLNNKGKYFALRDKKGFSYVSVELLPNERGVYNIVAQVKGKGNSPVGDKFDHEIKTFLDAYVKMMPEEHLKNSKQKNYFPLEFREPDNYLPEAYREDKLTSFENSSAKRRAAGGGWNRVEI